MPDEADGPTEAEWCDFEDWQAAQESQAASEFFEEQWAIHEGLATELTHCYLCYLEATGKPDTSPKQNLGPLRGILRHTTSMGSDPYDVQHLNCGHALI